MDKKKFACICFLLCCIHFGFSQPIDTTVNVNKKILRKRGFYKTYQEYITNSPSVSIDFEMDSITMNIRGVQKLIGCTCKVSGTDMDKLYSSWGFCDGLQVFVKPTRDVFSNKFWKLQCDGKVPYFFLEFLRKTTRAVRASLVAPLPIELLYSLNKDNYIHQLDVGIVNQNGNVLAATQGNISHLLASKPSLLKEFKQEREFTIVEKEEYLIKYNMEK